MKKPYQVTAYGNDAVLSSHSTLANAKRAISARWNHLRRKMRGTVYTVSFDVMFKGKAVYGRGGYV